MFKKLSLFLATMLISFSLVACNGNQPNNSETPNPTEENQTSSNIASTEKQPTESNYIVNEFDHADISNISVSDTIIKVEISYTGEHQLNLGEWFALEIYENGKWYTLPYKAEITWHQVAYPVEPNQSRSMEYDWSHVYNSLSAGKYRIVIKAMDFVKTGDYTNYYLAAGFEIK